MSRKPHSPTPETRRLATILAGWGLSSRQVATAVDVSHKTALKWYANELADGAVAAETSRLAAHLDTISKRPLPLATASSAAGTRAPGRSRAPIRKLQK